MQGQAQEVGWPWQLLDLPQVWQLLLLGPAPTYGKVNTLKQAETPIITVLKVTCPVIHRRRESCLKRLLAILPLLSRLLPGLLT